MERLRRRRKTAWEIALETGIPASTVSRHLKQQGLGRIWRLEEELDPPQRYEHAAPGDLFHIDAKRFARIEGVGHAIHGDRSRKKRGVGWEVAFVCVDDHTRLAYAEVLPAENAKYAVAFFRRALRWFGRLGIRCQRLLTDNAKCYAEAKAFHTLCEEEGILQSFTRPYTPKTNGKRSASSRRSSDAGPIANRSGPPRSGPPRFPPGSSTTIITDPIEAWERNRPWQDSDRPANNVLSRLRRK